MSAQEVSEKLRETAVRVRRLKAKRVTIGNYEEILKEAWDIVFSVIEATYELSQAVAALQPQVTVEVNVESDKEKVDGR